MAHSFFSLRFHPQDITPEDYKNASYYIDAIKAVATGSSESVIVIDYYEEKFLYISPDYLSRDRNDAEIIIDVGEDHYILNIPEEDRNLLKEIHSIYSDFINQYPIHERPRYIMSYDFHIVKNGLTVLVHCRHISLAMDKHGQVWIGVCLLSPSTKDGAGNMQMHKLDEAIWWSYNTKEKRWIEKLEIRLTEKEREVLMLSVRGFTVEEIATQIYRSKESVKSRCKKIFSKLGVSTMREAIIVAINKRLI